MSRNNSLAKIFTRHLKIFVESGGQGADEVTIACLQGIAGGTLLYVVMFEVMLRHNMTDITCMYVFT